MPILFACHTPYFARSPAYTHGRHLQRTAARKHGEAGSGAHEEAAMMETDALAPSGVCPFAKCYIVFGTIVVGSESLFQLVPGILLQCSSIPRVIRREMALRNYVDMSVVLKT